MMNSLFTLFLFIISLFVCSQGTNNNVFCGDSLKKLGHPNDSLKAFREMFRIRKDLDDLSKQPWASRDFVRPIGSLAGEPVRCRKPIVLFSNRLTQNFYRKEHDW